MGFPCFKESIIIIGIGIIEIESTNQLFKQSRHESEKNYSNQLFKQSQQINCLNKVGVRVES